MNAIGLLLVWTALQVSVFCLAGIGLYAVARRVGPAAGAWAAGTALVLAIGISALALSPWPRWWSLDAAEPIAQVTVPEGGRMDLTVDETPDFRLPPGMMSGPIEKRAAGDAQDADAPRQPRQTWQAALSGFRNDVSRASVALSQAEWRWPAWLAVAILAGCALALVRLSVAVCVAHRYRMAARPVSEPLIVELLEQVRVQIGCARPVELRETSLSCSPSTIGWLRPAIILPADWRTWSGQECRAVLAHEVAHVARGDFAIWLVAQLGVVLHFYNPLVHWLARRLRLEQEMAADVCGAQLAGGRQFYLTTLAEMALRRNDPPLAWAARPFLPARGTLMRRVEMLHHCKNLPSVAVSHTRRAALAAMLLVAACFLAGFRPPGTANQAEGAPPAAKKAAAEPFNLDFVPNDAHLVLALRPAVLAKIKGLDSVKMALTAIGLFEPLGLPLAEIEECKLVTGFTDAAATRPWGLIVVRSKKPHDWSRLATYFAGETKEVIAAGQKYFESINPRGGMLKSYWLPDDRTILLASTDMIVDTFSLRGDLNEPGWAAGWRTVATGPAAMMVKTKVLQSGVAGLNLNTGEAAGHLTEEADVVLLGSSEADGVLDVQGTMQCRSPQSARRAGAILAATFANFKRFTEQFHNQGPAPPVTIFRLLAQLADATKLEVKASTVVSRTAVNLKVDKQAFAEQLTQAREAALRNASTNKLKQLGIAMQNYHDVYKHFPPAVLIGPDGKTPYSWRVALLPFLEKNELYKRYKKDEPWDSEHNRQLIAEAAELFSVPTQEPNNDCGYFVLAGPGTVFDPNQPPASFRDIRDGSSKTIGIVEARRSIPWTKPEDIEYDPTKPLPKLGGFFPGGHHVGFMDASVRFLPENTDDATIRALISRAGREPVAIPDEAPREPPRGLAIPVGAAARRARSVNTMKQIGIAMQNYHDKNGHFPSSVVVGADGKTPHSWRVELLPYFEEEKLQKLYEQYKLDEPWDSDQNRTLIAGGAEFFGTASDTPKGESCYFMLAGPGTMADPANPGPRIRNITDGTSNTIYFVEAKRSIPWTKPQDIEYDPAKPPPKLGGFFEGGFDASFVDGSVHFLPDDLDDATLRALLSTRGGEVIGVEGDVPKVRAPK